ncbi:MAG TPA: beta-1,6-N-acetylglucosaminyltransferase [Acidiphilium sp.]
MPRIAVLVLAHKAESLPYLTALLPEPFEVFVHFDAKAGDPPDLKQHNVRYITPRHAVYWGGFSMVEASLALLHAAISTGDFERFLFISGDTLPVRHSASLAEALLWPHVEYIELKPIPDDPATHGQSREEISARWGTGHAGRFYNFQYWDSLLTNPFTEAELMRATGLDQANVQKLRGEAAHLVRSLAGRLPLRPRLFQKFFFGSQWWDLSRKLVERLQDQIFSDQTKEYFRFMEVPDEHYLPCIIGNQREILEKNGQCILGPPVFRDYATEARGQAFASAETLRGAAANQCLLMRKFDPKAAPNVADAILAGRYADEILGL